MFDLEQKIAEWRREMLAAGIKTPAPLEELETHLRDEIERQLKVVPDEAEAFKTAVQKVGRAQLVQNEFRKMEAGKLARQRKTADRLMVACLGFIFLLVGSVVIFKPGDFSGATFNQQMSCLAAIAQAALLSAGGRLGYRFFPVIRAKAARTAVGLLCCLPALIWWTVFWFVILPRLEVTLETLFVTIICALFAPMGIFVGLCSGIETAAWKKMEQADL